MPAYGGRASAPPAQPAPAKRHASARAGTLQPDSVSIDRALAAHTVRHHHSTLRPFLVRALRDVIAARREASFARLNSACLATPAGALARG